MLETLYHIHKHFQKNHDVKWKMVNFTIHKLKNSIKNAVKPDNDIDSDIDCFSENALGQ